MNIFERMARIQRIHAIAFDNAAGVRISQNEWALRRVHDGPAAWAQGANCHRPTAAWFAAIGHREVWHDDPLQALAALENAVEDAARNRVADLLSEHGAGLARAQSLAAKLNAVLS